MIKMGWELGWETDYVVSVYPPPPHTIHPPHQIATILEESVIVLRGLRIHSDNIVYYMVTFEAHQYFRGGSCPQYSTTKLPRVYQSVVESAKGGGCAPIRYFEDVTC